MKEQTNGVKKSAFAKLKGFLSGLFYPDNIKCIFCGDDVPDYEAKPICDRCEKNVRYNSGNRCLICAEPIENEAMVCDECQLHKRSFKRAFCPFVYDGNVRKAILAYKDSNRRYLAKPFAKQIVKELKESGISFDYVTFVPLTEKKKKKRGFDQAELLATYIAEGLNVPVFNVFEKIKDGKAQKKLGYNQRFENTQDMYRLLPHRFKRKDTVLIVDDVITTGATTGACAKLIEKKVANVYAAAIARNVLDKNKKRGK